jgi:hypothetical protein
VEGTGAASSQTQLSGGRSHRRSRPLQIGPARLDSSRSSWTWWVQGAGSFEQGGGRFAHLLSRQGCRLADELEGAWGRLRVHAQVAQQPGYGGYLGVEAAMAGDGCERKFQHALTVEVEAWMAGEAAGCGDLGSSCARPQAPVLSRHQRLEAFGGLGHSVAVSWWPSPAVSMPPDSLCTMAAWFVGEGPHLLRPLIGLPLRSKGKEWMVVGDHGVAVCCARMDSNGWCAAHVS